jgi:hypothetical protein
LAKGVISTGGGTGSCLSGGNFGNDIRRFAELVRSAGGAATWSGDSAAFGTAGGTLAPFPRRSMRKGLVRPTSVAEELALLLVSSFGDVGSLAAESSALVGGGGFVGVLVFRAGRGMAQAGTIGGKDASSAVA